MATKLRTALVVNPISGGKRSDRVRGSVVSAFRELSPGAPIERSSSTGDTIGIVRDLLGAGWECIAVAGGDGTMNEAVNGYFEPLPEGWTPDPGRALEPVNPQACLACIPLGTGGDFRRTLGLEPDAMAALSLLGGTSTRSCDVGSVACSDGQGGRRTRLFVNITSFGLSGLVDDHVNRTYRGLPGQLAFFLATVRSFVEYSNPRIRVLVDRRDQQVVEAVVAAVANGRFFGGGMEIAPPARMDDGLLDVVTVGDLGLADFLMHAGRIYGGRILEHPLITHRRASHVLIDTIDPQARVLMDLDGEPVGSLPATLAVHPGALKLKS